jgi:Ca-activated chloride channel family protein
MRLTGPWGSFRKYKDMKTVEIFAGVLFFGLCYACHALAAENPDELYRQGRFEEAEKAYSRSDMDNPKDIRYRYNRGCAAYQNSDFKGAVAAFSSVLRRSDNDEIQFKAAYNLGNTAFKAGNFESAVEQYKEALLLNPENEDAKYNLELALWKLEKQKNKKTQEQNKAGEKDPGQSKDQGENSSSGEKKEDTEQKQDQGQDQKNSRDQEQPGRQEDNQEKNHERPDEGQKTEQDKARDLAGQLKPLQAMPEKDEEQPPDQPGAILDRKKAEALLNNLEEDRSRFLRFQIPEDKKQGVQSGKDW